LTDAEVVRDNLRLPPPGEAEPVPTMVYAELRERQLRPLAPLDPDEQRAAFSAACAVAGPDRAPTYREVEAAARQVRGEPEPRRVVRVAIDPADPRATAKDIVNALGGDYYRINLLIQAIADLSHDPLHTWACLKKPRRLRPRPPGESA
jgi:hypothetical protein